jgi:hypothetical protein
MGNRGRLHDDRQRVVRSFQVERWLLCVLRFKDRQRTVMSPRQYTELFFLDEATGLAAGHRPCAECQRPRYRAFVEAWSRGNPGATENNPPRAAAVDAVLHRERIDNRSGKRVHAADFGDLPPGAIVLLDRDDEAALLQDDALFPWSFSGYRAPLRKPATGATRLLTPPSVVNALRAGYVAGVHPSAVTSPRDGGHP